MSALQTNSENLLILSDLYRFMALGLEEMDWKNQSLFFDTLKDFLSIPFQDYEFYKKGNYQQEISILNKLTIYEKIPLEAEYHRMFNTQTGIPFSEGSYVSLEKGNLIGDVMGFYKAVGYPFNTEKHGSPDAIKVELGFISFLFLKEFNILVGDEFLGEEKEEKLEILRDLRDKFYFEHLLPWVPEFMNTLINSSNHEFYINLMAILKTLIENYRNYLKN
ncbi:MAG: molecular chaperone TorD family protein [Leptonema sp. (in: bacteria)]